MIDQSSIPSPDTHEFRWGMIAPGGIDVNDAARELYKIWQRDQKVTPASVVLAATPKRSPLHPAFEWDDMRAAELGREFQAANLIRSVRVVHRVDVDGAIEERLERYLVRVTPSENIERALTGQSFDSGRTSMAFDESDRDLVTTATSRGAYIPAAVALQSPVLSQRLIEQALREMEAFKRKYESLHELAEVMRAMDDTMRAVKAKPAKKV